MIGTYDFSTKISGIILSIYIDQLTQKRAILDKQSNFCKISKNSCLMQRKTKRGYGMYADARRILRSIETFRSRSFNLRTSCRRKFAVFIVAMCIIFVLFFSSCYAAMHFCRKCQAHDCPICLNVDEYRNGTHGSPLIIALMFIVILPALLSFQNWTFHQKNTLFELRIRLNN
jgi:hypothetical protein